MGKKVILANRRKLERILIAIFCVAITIASAYVLFFSYTPNRNSLGALASVSMDVLSILIVIVLVMNLAFEKYGVSKITKLFLALLIGTMVGLFLDFLTWTTDGSLAYGDWSYIYTTSSLCMGSVLALSFVAYLSCYLAEVHNLKRIHFSGKICMGCNVAAFLLTITLAITGKGFVFVDGHYQTGPLYDFVTLIPILTLLHMTAYAIKHVKVIGLHDVVAVTGYISIMIAGALIESAYSIGTTYVSVTIANIFIFVMLQNRIIALERKNAQKWMMKSNTDELTDYSNRHAYEEKIAKLESGIIDDNFVYVSMDVNELKIVNDTLGHAAGDELILGACECMTHSFGSYGELFRTGGDEFVALIYANDAQLESIKKDFAKEIEKWSGELVEKLTVSCGYVTRKEAEKMTLHQMAVLADQRMYEEKTRHYQKKGIDRRGQKDAHTALCSLYTKILKVNITDDTYEIVDWNIDSQYKEDVAGKSISGWLKDSEASGQIHPEDAENYLAKTNLEYLSDYFKKNDKSLIITYRRKSSEGYKKAMMEIIHANDYTDEEQNLFLYVKNIE